MTDSELYADLLRRHHRATLESSQIVAELYKELRKARKAQESTAKQAKRWKTKYMAANNELSMYVEAQTAGVFES